MSWRTLATQRTDPVIWARDVCGFEADDAQGAILRAISKPNAIVIVEACNGPGKTATDAVVALWHFAHFRPGKTITTSGGERQVNTQLWDEIRQRARKAKAHYPDWNIAEKAARVEQGDGHYLIGYSSDNPDTSEGWHSPHLLIIVDEAKAIPERMWNAITSTMTSGDARLLITTVPGDPNGYVHRKAMSGGVTHIRIVPEQERAHIPPASNIYYSDRIRSSWIAEMETDFGRDSAIFKRRVWGLASVAVDNPYFSEAMVKRMFGNYASSNDGSRGIAIDWGRTKSYTAVTEWVGRMGELKLYTHTKGTGTDYMDVVNKVAVWHGEKRYDWIIVDEGEGRGQLDRMKELNLPVTGFNFGSSIEGQPAKLLVMSTLRMAMECGEIGFKHDSRVEEEFSAFTSKPTAEGRMKLEAAEGFHDDIVCSVAMGWWKAKGSGSASRFLVSTTR